jgi:beta-lactam-binding protein with PASTA domain
MPSTLPVGEGVTVLGEPVGDGDVVSVGDCVGEAVSVGDTVGVAVSVMVMVGLGEPEPLEQAPRPRDTVPRTTATVRPRRTACMTSSSEVGDGTDATTPPGTDARCAAAPRRIEREP